LNLQQAWNQPYNLYNQSQTLGTAENDKYVFNDEFPLISELWIRKVDIPLRTTVADIGGQQSETFRAGMTVFLVTSNF